jgi:AraC-like DNA-binding protein
VTSKSTAQQGPIPAQFCLDLAIRPGNAQDFDLWRFGLSPLYAMDAYDRTARAAFHCTMTSYQFADVAISYSSSSPATFVRNGRTIAHSGIDTICVLIYATGGGELDAAGRLVEIQPGDVCILDQTRPNTVRARADFSDLSFIIPRALIEPLIPNLDSLHGLILKRSDPLARMLTIHLQSLFREAPSLRLQDARAATHGTVALIAAFAGASSNSGEGARQAAAFTALQAVRRTIEEHLESPGLGPEFLSQKLGMSRATLYRLFEPIGGVREYIRQRRLTRAYQRITDRTRAPARIGTIAAECGFTSNAVFSRTFRDAYGMSPNDVRRAWDRGERTAPGLPQDNPFVAMNRWLIGMEAAGR